MIDRQQLFQELASKHLDSRGVLDADSLIREINSMLGLAYTPPRQMLQTVSRHTGYTVQSASCEYSDNVLSPEIKANFFAVTFTQVGRKLMTICFADDGISMDSKTISIFWTLADAAHFFDMFSLSKFGVGAKGGGYFFGNTITLYTKVDGVITKTKQTFDSFPKINWCDSEEDRITQEEIDMVNEKLHNSDHGTVIIISDLILEEKMTKTIVSNRIKDGYKEFYCENEFIKNGSKHIYVDGEEIKPLSIFGIKGSTIVNGEDIMAKNLIREREIKIEGFAPIRYIAAHKSRCYITDKEHEYDFNNPGIYIVRNGRLLTSKPIMDSDILGRKVGCIKHKQFCAVLYITGDHDSLFKLTFNKVINSLDELDSKVKEVLTKYIRKDVLESEHRYMKEGQGDVSADTKDSAEKANDFLKDLLKGFEKTKIYSRTNPKPDPKPGPKPDPKPDPKPRNKKEFGVGFINPGHFGERGDFIYTEMGDNLCHWTVNINIDHPLYNTLGLENNYKTMAIIGYLEITMHLGVMTKYEETMDEEFFVIYNELVRIEEIRERFTRDIIDKTIVLREPNKVSAYKVRKMEGCQGVNVNNEELELEFTTAAR